MPKRKVFCGQDICDLLRAHGFEAVRQRGSHRVMQKKEGASTITVPVPLHKELKPGTLGSIIRQSRLDRSLFES
jgi:predicted RNA binding protein YcfA (HicA-like mRNA interferase family)